MERKHENIKGIKIKLKLLPILTTAIIILTLLNSYFIFILNNKVNSLTITNDNLIKETQPLNQGNQQQDQQQRIQVDIEHK